MKVLGHIHTLNDSDVIEGTVRALQRQTRPLDGILLIDNASTDGTLDREFPDEVTIIRHPENRGTNGSVITGFEYALAHNFDWIWLFDADSRPRENALEVLLELYASLPPEEQERVSFLSSLPYAHPGMEPWHGAVFGGSPNPYDQRDGTMQQGDSGKRYYRCDVTIWSGTLYRLKCVERIGLPNADYVLDWGEAEYGYKAMRAGLKGYVHQESVLDHDVRGVPSTRISSLRVGPLAIETFEFPPIRCYYKVRNLLYFWFHEYQFEYRKVKLMTRFGAVYRALKFTSNFLIRPFSRGPELKACIRGVRDGLVGRIDRRF